MWSCVSGGAAVWACDWFIGEELLSVSASGGMIGYESGHACTHSIGAAKVLEP